MTSCRAVIKDVEVIVLSCDHDDARLSHATRRVNANHDSLQVGGRLLNTMGKALSQN